MKVELNKTNMFSFSIVDNKLTYTRLIDGKLYSLTNVVDNEHKAFMSLQSIANLDDTTFIEFSIMQKGLETNEEI